MNFRSVKEDLISNRRPRRQRNATGRRANAPRTQPNTSGGTNTRGRRARQAAQPYPIAPRPTRGICSYFENLSTFI